MAKHLAQHNAVEQQASLPQIKEARLTESFGQGLNKKQIASLADHSVDNVLEDGNVFQVAEALAAMEEFVKAVRKDERYVQFLRDELAKHQGKLTTSSGAKIEACEAGVTYNYSHSAEWNELDEAIKVLTERKKAVEEKLRKVAPGRIAVDGETGEVIEGAFKKSKSTYRITLAK
jgi:hypothetical protein